MPLIPSVPAAIAAAKPKLAIPITKGAQALGLGSMFKQFAAPVGSLLSGLSSFYGGSNNDAIRLAEKQFEQGISTRVRDATNAGIHPLYAIGANIPSYSGFSQDSGPTGAQIAGQVLGHQLEQYGRKQKSPMQLRVEGLELERRQLENDRLRAEISALGQGTAVQPPEPAPGTTPANAIPTHLYAKTPQGKIIRFINPDLGMETPEVIGAWMYLSQNSTPSQVYDFVFGPWDRLSKEMAEKFGSNTVGRIKGLLRQ